MPFRVIGYDGAAYRSQLLNNKSQEKEREKGGQLRCPVVTIILYFGEKPWNYPQNLKGCFYPPLPKDKAGKLLDSYIQDYKIHVFDIPRLPKETREKFQSDFKVVAEYFANAYTNPLYKPEPHVIRLVDEFLKLMKVLTGDNRYENIMFSKEEKREGINVCKVLDYREARGEARGKAEGKAEGILSTLLQLVRDGLLDVSVGIERSGVSEEEFKKRLEQV